ncbi:FecCD family ABC transporter permease [Thermomonospora umbrina]|uniref:Iron complex transport system permease protein n=1 Tax=Thermomonospora umbrina TaxID=111806 RepID=A0A3D9T5L9_9ACTN|nr:iron chelate uptake ABC transporter family permease subunit [Thermomonospora umbrina]REF00005.1 iron complex transport system permease protein [Thermomonospora umbrina]
MREDKGPSGPSAATPGRRLTFLVGALGLLVLLCLLSIAVGSRQIPLDQVVRALTGPHDTEVGRIVWDVRLPRTLLGLLAGAALGLGGAIMQALTRNPLADPGLLGVSAGAGFGLMLAVGLAGISSLYGYVWFAFAGAAVASVVVYVLGGVGRSGQTPVKLALAGIAVTFLLESVTRGVSLIDPQVLNRYRFWSSGSLTGQNTALIVQVLPFLAVGAVLALSLAPALNNLALGDDVAASLGRRLLGIRLQGAVAVTLLTGTAVALAGPIVFVGLVIPHAVRAVSGPDQRWLLPLSALLAPCLLLAADVAGRVVVRPEELDVGIVSALIGAPFFIMLVRRRRLAEL